jgi:hypothetical protein
MPDQSDDDTLLKPLVRAGHKSKDFSKSELSKAKVEEDQHGNHRDTTLTLLAAAQASNDEQSRQRLSDSRQQRLKVFLFTQHMDEDETLP